MILVELFAWLWIALSIARPTTCAPLDSTSDFVTNALEREQHDQEVLSPASSALTSLHDEAPYPSFVRRQDGQSLTTTVASPRGSSFPTIASSVSYNQTSTSTISETSLASTSGAISSTAPGATSILTTVTTQISSSLNPSQTTTSVSTGAPSASKIPTDISRTIAGSVVGGIAAIFIGIIIWWRFPKTTHRDQRAEIHKQVKGTETNEKGKTDRLGEEKNDNVMSGAKVDKGHGQGNMQPRPPSLDRSVNL